MGTGVWGSWAMGNICNGDRDNAVHGVMGGTSVMGHMGDGAHEQWLTWVMGNIDIIIHRSRCQNLRLPHIFLISDLNTCPILMYEYANQSLGPPLQEYEVILPLGGYKVS